MSITTDVWLCIEAPRRVGDIKYGSGEQVAIEAFTDIVSSHGIAISMDGEGSWKNKVFVERLWKSVKYEDMYLIAYDSVSDARAGLGRYFEFYNVQWPHSSLGGMTPEECYIRLLPEPEAAQTKAS